ncbi:uncharacterized protein [Tenebrio molitor]|jgi:hypothetical protein|uniref:uncharacterized protein isoform X6 n=1 Tax=Tenebrio molitor TaxID=7067 RepID=UPI0036247060
MNNLVTLYTVGASIFCLCVLFGCYKAHSRYKLSRKCAKRVQNGTSPVVVPPYPVEPRHPTPHGGPPGPGFATNHPPYPTHTPHPMPGAAPTPYPSAAPYPPVGPTGHAPYPPVVGGTAPYPDYSAQPPSYSEAISQPPVQPPLGKEGYSKQAPYNPNY